MVVKITKLQKPLVKRISGDDYFSNMRFKRTKQSFNPTILPRPHFKPVSFLTPYSIVTHKLSFDPWGLRRNAETWGELSPSELNRFKLTTLDLNSAVTTRGYTGHEMLDSMGLIHMNGRIYDPKLARFMQADPHIDGVTNTQGYNRYSYVQNNPLNATDPSGYWVQAVAWAVGTYVVGRAAAKNNRCLE